MEAPVIYNLFPRLVGHFDHWSEHAARARRMGFNWLYVNPLHYPGFSGSLYSVKDYYRVNPLFIPPGEHNPAEALRHTLDQLHDQGLRVMMDLVINHTAIDSILAEQHPDWFCRDEDGGLVSPSAIDPADARKVTVWGDLAEIDNAGSADREGLWKYWKDLVRYHLELGFDGFRCDAAYKVPAELWQELTTLARSIKPEALFLAETLGCRLKEVRQLAGVGIDYLYNSSKYWNFDAPWALEQHAEFGAIAPSVSFAESHDTPRLMEQSGGLEQVQRQRYLFSAVFAAGLLMPLGFEYGFRRRVDVVTTQPEQWEQTDVDLTGFITRVNRLKAQLPTLQQEGRWEVLTDLASPTTLLCKRGAAGARPVVLAVNKDWHQPQCQELPPLEGTLAGEIQVLRPFHAEPPAPLTGGSEIHLDPAEIAIIY